MAPRKPKQGKTTVKKQNEHLQQQVFVLAFQKLMNDYVLSRGSYKECTEMFFQEWIFNNFYTWTAEFEREMMRAFVTTLLKRGRQETPKKHG